MDFHELLERYNPVIRQYWLVFTLALVGLILLGYGLIGLLGSSGSGNDIVFESENAPSPSVKNIMVDIEGAVVKPGVYSLKSDSRIQDALVAASGLSEAADRNWLAKNLNLAAKLSDGAKIYVPRVGEAKAGSATSITGNTGVAQSGQININAASLEELDTLPGVGPVTAQKIISARPYGTTDELVSRKIVTSKVFEKIKEKITAY